MANQFTKGTRKHHDEATKDKTRAEMLSRRLYKYANAKGKNIQKYAMEPAQVAAAKVLIERGKPALQSIEQRHVDEPPTEAEIMAQLHTLLSDPGARAQIQAMLAGSPTPVATQQSTAASDTDVSKAA
jgi:vacuolar-type H+-ATPase subunit E/Vma4